MDKIIWTKLYRERKSQELRFRVDIHACHDVLRVGSQIVILNHDCDLLILIGNLSKNKEIPYYLIHYT